MQKYKQLRDSSGPRKPWKFFDVLHETLHNKPEIALHNIIDIGVKEKKGIIYALRDFDFFKVKPTNYYFLFLK